MQSIYLNSKIHTDTTEILIITSSNLEQTIADALSNCHLKIRYHIDETAAAAAKWHVFDSNIVSGYDKILYLDTDILINDNINTLFNAPILPDKLYLLKCEGNDINSSRVLLFSGTAKTLLENVQIGVIDSKNLDTELLETHCQTDPKHISKSGVLYIFTNANGPSRYERIAAFWETMTEVAFVTLSNTGYIKYTLNCLESLKRIGTPIQLHTYVIGKAGYDILKSNGHKCTLIDDDENSNFQEFNAGNWRDITYQKIKIIYDNLKFYKYVLYTDGDIVFEDGGFLQYLKNNIGENAMLAQTEFGHKKMREFCSGFMFIKSSPQTLMAFDPMDAEVYKEELRDQQYLNQACAKLKYAVLPIELFPNGKYYYTKGAPTPYLIHFNWTVGHAKETKMKLYKKWYLV